VRSPAGCGIPGPGPGIRTGRAHRRGRTYRRRSRSGAQGRPRSPRAAGRGARHPPARCLPAVLAARQPARTQRTAPDLCPAGLPRRRSGLAAGRAPARGLAAPAGEGRRLGGFQHAVRRSAQPRRRTALHRVDCAPAHRRPQCARRRRTPMGRARRRPPGMRHAAAQCGRHRHGGRRSRVVAHPSPDRQPQARDRTRQPHPAARRQCAAPRRPRAGDPLSGALARPPAAQLCGDARRARGGACRAGATGAR